MEATPSPSAPSQAPSRETVLEMPTLTKAAVWVVLGAAGVGLGLALPWLLQNASQWPIPYLGALEALGSIDSPLMVIGRPAVLGLVGLVFAFFITHEAARLAITDERIRITEGDDTRVVTREQVAGVYRRGSKVRIDSPEGRVLFDEDVEGGKAAVAAAFISHGYPWESTVGRAGKARQ